jgi:hypothetical protein
MGKHPIEVLKFRLLLNTQEVILTVCVAGMEPLKYGEI